jgi:FKBP-type peptidyl-prolyl cis-trans isomerase
MKFSLFMAMAASVTLVLALARADDKPAPKAAEAELKDTREKGSYGLGLSFGKSLGVSFPDLDPELFAQGVRDALGGKAPRLTDLQVQEAIQAFQQEAIAKRAKEGELWLAENKKKPGVVTLPSGLQYKVLKEGTGKIPKATDTVTVNYEGRLTDATVFDSSAKAGQPVSFQVGGVIPGFREALLAMKAGAKWQLYIPAPLAYGPTPPPGSRIPPNSPLVFDLELLEVKEAGR